jgi:hypothetical protein
MHPIKGYGPSLSDQGVDPADAPLVSAVRNCHGCQIEYDRETGAATVLYCADHDLDEHYSVLEEARDLYAALRRLTDGMHTGDHEDAPGALDQASALLGRLADQYEDEGARLDRER